MTTIDLKADHKTLNANRLLDYPEESLGFQLGVYLLRHNFDFEMNDIFRVLTRYRGNFNEEICLQYYLLGNGRRNLLSMAFMLGGTLLEAHKFPAFYAAFKKGRNAHRFYDLKFSKMLAQPLVHIQSTLNIL